VIAWLTRKFSRDPGQLGLFEMPTAKPDLRTALTGVPDAPARRITDDLAPQRAVAPPAIAPDPAVFLRALQRYGLRGVERVVLTRNRRTMVSLAGGVLRVHEGFVHAPADVQAAIATFATSRNRARRSAARDVIVEYPVPIRPAARRPASQHADDLPMAVRLTTLHAQLNLEHFAGALEHLEIQVSRRLARRLGHYTPRSHNGGIGEIVISRRHVRRDGWPEAIHTLLHEMVHQWQDETGAPIDHGSGFRAKCRAVGIEPAATRMIAG
jgi:SprT-like family